MPAAQRSEVWLVDLGMVGKVRPALVLSVPFEDQDRALVTAIAHTTSVRGSRFEVRINVRFLDVGAFDAQNMVTIPHAKLIRKLGSLTPEQMALVETAAKAWLGFDTPGAMPNPPAQMQPNTPDSPTSNDPT